MSASTETSSFGSIAMFNVLDMDKTTRSNNRGIMGFVTYPTSGRRYFLWDVRLQRFTYSGTLNAVKKAWNRHYANTRQWTSGNGVNHRYL